jgi:hypothetical protein
MLAICIDQCALIETFPIALHSDSRVAAGAAVAEVLPNTIAGADECAADSNGESSTSSSDSEEPGGGRLSRDSSAEALII